MQEKLEKLIKKAKIDDYEWNESEEIYFLLGNIAAIGSKDSKLYKRFIKCYSYNNSTIYNKKLFKKNFKYGKESSIHSFIYDQIKSLIERKAILRYNNYYDMPLLIENKKYIIFIAPMMEGEHENYLDFCKDFEDITGCKCPIIIEDRKRYYENNRSEDDL